jgi:hypothetical protein
MDVKKFLIFMLLLEIISGEVALIVKSKESSSVVGYLDQVIDFYTLKDTTQDHDIAFLKIPSTASSSIYDQLIEKVSQKFVVTQPAPINFPVPNVDGPITFIKSTFCVFFSSGKDIVSRNSRRFSGPKKLKFLFPDCNQSSDEWCPREQSDSCSHEAISQRR